MNEQVVYSYIKLAKELVQKYYLTLLKQRQAKFKLFDDEIDHDERETELIYLSNYSTKSFEQLLNNYDFEFTSKKPWRSYFRSSTTSRLSLTNENYSTLRLNAFHAIFQYLLSYLSLKLIGSDIFAFELAHLLSSLRHNQIYLYRMNPNETSILPITETNALLVTLFQVFSKFIHEPIIQTNFDEKHRPTLNIIEQFHQFKMNLNAEEQLEI